jgi:hypothetical protein
MDQGQNTLFSGKETKRVVIPGLKLPKKKKEEKVQIKVCNYLHKAYPKAIFTCDLSSGMKLPIHIAAKNKQMRSSRGLPDLFIAYPKVEHYDVDEAGNGGSFKVFYGLWIELKSEDTVIWNKDGTMRKGDHLEEQKAVLDHLEKRGYRAVFACGYSEAKKIIDQHMEHYAYNEK